MDGDWIDRQALLDAGLDLDDPQVWAQQRRVRSLLQRRGQWTRLTSSGVAGAPAHADL
jgi:hypothetical protein